MSGEGEKIDFLFLNSRGRRRTLLLLLSLRAPHPTHTGARTTPAPPPHVFLGLSVASTQTSSVNQKSKGTVNHETNCKKVLTTLNYSVNGKKRGVLALPKNGVGVSWVHGLEEAVSIVLPRKKVKTCFYEELRTENKKSSLVLAGLQHSIFSA